MTFMPRGHFNHKGRIGKLGGSLPKGGLPQLFSILKGGAGSGNIGHAGIPGHRGGSAPKGAGKLKVEGIVITGSGTKRQKQHVIDTLKLAGKDSDILERIEVHNTQNLNHLIPPSLKRAIGIQRDEDVGGFSTRPDLKNHIKGNRIVLAGKNKLLTRTILHELAHLLGTERVSESDADAYAIKILGHTTEAWEG